MHLLCHSGGFQPFSIGAANGLKLTVPKPGKPEERPRRTNAPHVLLGLGSC